MLDSEIDADRMDSVARDGLLAGGEYGNYDLERLYASVRCCKIRRQWRMAFSDKSLSTLESVLFERMRTHTWVHFHHRVIATKVAARLAIQGMLSGGLINVGDFKDLNLLPYWDDIQFYSLLRNWQAPEGSVWEIAKSALTRRDTRRLCVLWKRRADYARHMHAVFERAKKKPSPRIFKTLCKGILQNPHFSCGNSFQVYFYSISFTPYNEEAEAYVVVDHPQKRTKRLSKISGLVRGLRSLWEEEPQFYPVAFVDKDTLKNHAREVIGFLAGLARGPTQNPKR